MTNGTSKASGKIFYGWWVVAVAAVGMFLGYGAIFNFTFGVFSAAVGQEFHWSRSSISLAYSLALIAYGFSTPVTGRWADRYGARRVIVPSIVLFALSLVSMSFLTGSVWQFSVVCMLMGFLSSGSAVVPYFGVITQWFDKRRGLALGLAMIGVGTSNFTMPSLAQALISSIGWRHAYQILGCAVIVAAIPVGFFLRERPQMMGLLPDGEPVASVRPGKRGALSGLTGREALRDGTFWLLFTAIFLVAMSVIGCLIHLVPMLKDRGMSPQAAAFATSVFGGAVIPGRVGSGYLLDKIFARYVALVFFCGASAGILLFVSGVAGSMAYLAAFLVGMGMGAEGELIAYLVSRYFGLRAFGEVFGYAMLSFTLGGIIGPPLMGVGFDKTGSYRLVLGFFLVATLAGAGLMLKLGPYRVWESAKEPTIEPAAA